MRKMLVFVLCVGLLLIALPATAGQWDKATTVTFAQAVELPNIILQPGTYIFRLLDTPGNRHVVQVFNAEETHLYTTILAIPNYQLKASEKTIMPFEERAPGRPEALHAWFYPADTFGQEFVYPKARAAELAKATAKPVLGAEITPNETPQELLEAPVLTFNPEQQQTEIAAVAPPMEPTWEPPMQAVHVPAELPKTASPMPLIGLVALTSLGFAVMLRVLRKRLS
jgi:hypothetical protein